MTHSRPIFFILLLIFAVSGCAREPANSELAERVSMLERQVDSLQLTSLSAHAKIRDMGLLNNDIMTMAPEFFERTYDVAFDECGKGCAAANKTAFAACESGPEGAKAACHAQRQDNFNNCYSHCVQQYPPF